nr:MAG TPA: hypothetical protein [Caudoviricetes sp.]
MKFSQILDSFSYFYVIVIKQSATRTILKDKVV